MKPISRKQAREVGRPRYFTARPCLRGHLAERLVSTATCVVCAKLLSSEWAAASPTARREQGRVSTATWRAKNPEAARHKVRKWRAANLERERARVREFLARDSSRRAESRAAWRAMKKRQMPAWADRVSIATFYRLARQLTEKTGIAHHVDHVIPLCGREVSGLHVQTNLRVVTAHENRCKSNRYDENNTGDLLSATRQGQGP